jgi:DNA polymerase-1
VDRKLADGEGAAMILQIHDELVLEVVQERVDEVSAMVTRAMETVVELDVPLKVNLETRQNLGKG